MLKKFYNKKNASITLAIILLVGLVIGLQLRQGISPNTASAASAPAPQLTGYLLEPWVSVNDVVFSPDGNKAYITSNRFGLLVLNTTDKTNPVIYGQDNLKYTSDSSAGRLAVSGNTAVITGTPRGTDIVDVSNPASPRIASSVAGSSRDVDIKNNYAYIISNDQKNVRIVDITNPDVPSEKTPIVSTYIGGISVIDNYLIMTDSFKKNMTIFDISTPLNPPQTVGTVVFHDNVDFVATGKSTIDNKNYAYATNNQVGSFHVVDISDPTHPVDKKTYFPDVNQKISISSITYKNNKIYITGSVIIDVSDPTQPTFMSKIDANGQEGDVFGNYFYSANGAAGLNVINVASPTSPFLEKTLSGSRASNQLAISGNTVVATGSGHGIDVIDISDPTHPKIMSSIAGNSVDVAIKDTYAYVAADGIVKVVDISNPTTASVKATINTATTTYGVSIIDNYLAIAAGPGGIVVADITDPLHPILKTPLALGGLAVKIATGNIGGKNYAFIANTGLGKLQVVDISNPDALNKVGEFSVPSAVNMTYKDKKIYLSAGVNATGIGFFIINVSNPSTPSLLGNKNIAVNAVDILGNYAFLATGDSGVTVADISNPASITVLNTYKPFNIVTDVLSSGNKLYANDDNVEFVISSFDLGVENITLAKTATPTSAKYGDKVTFSITAENTSLNQEKNVVLTDPIPANSAYVEGSATLDEVVVTDADDNDDVYKLNNGTPTWTFPSFSPVGETNSSHTVSFMVKYIINETQVMSQSVSATTSKTVTSIVSEPMPTTTPSSESSPTSTSTSTSTSTPTSQTLSNTTAHGTIIDSKTKKPVSGAKVSLLDGKSKIIETITDKNGKYTLKSGDIMPVKLYTLEIKKGSSYTAKIDLMLSVANTSSQVISVKKNNIFIRIWLTIKNVFTKVFHK